jgi:hypothetical protein
MASKRTFEEPSSHAKPNPYKRRQNRQQQLFGDSAAAENSLLDYETTADLLDGKHFTPFTSKAIEFLQATK